MVRTINVGVDCDSDRSLVAVQHNGYSNNMFICDMGPSLYRGRISTCCCILKGNGGGTGRYFTAYDNGSGSWTIRDTTSSFSISSGTSLVKSTLSGQTMSIYAGDYIGLCITNTDTGDAVTVWGNKISGDHCIYKTNQSCFVGTYTFTDGGDPGYIIHGTGYESDPGGTAPDACQDTGNMQINETYYGYGDIRVDDIECVGTQGASVHLTYPWGGTKDDVFDEYEKIIYEKSGSDPKEFWSVECIMVYCGATNLCEFTECWYRESDIYYVKTTGDDDDFGTTWTNAFQTITKAAGLVPNGGEVFIGFGTYNSETDIEPANFGSAGIKYRPVTAGSSSGTGSVTINL